MRDQQALNYPPGKHQMNQTAPEIIRIGNGTARVTTVTQERVEYLDAAGQKWFVDLAQCAKNWVQYHNKREGEFTLVRGATPESAAIWNSRCVGQRRLSDNPAWVEFMNERQTRFEFGTFEAAYAKLVGPLSNVGWHTFDLD